MSYLLRTASSRHTVHPALAFLCLCLLSGCIGAGYDSQRWVGTYERSDKRLVLHDTGKVEFDGGVCAAPFSDAMMSQKLSGQYRFDGAWVRLENLTESPAAVCGLSDNLYAITLDGRKVLLPESDFLDLINRYRSGEKSMTIYPFHRPGDPAKFELTSMKWLPQPYMDLLERKLPNSKIIHVSELTEGTLYLAPGDEGKRMFARVTVDIGARDGVFNGMWLCDPGSPANRFTVDTVTPDSATMTWMGPFRPRLPDPVVGMPVVDECPNTRAN